MTKDKKPALTPGGMRPESVVHHVESGQMVKGPEMVASSSAEPAGMRPTPPAQGVPSDPMAMDADVRSEDILHISNQLLMSEYMIAEPVE